MTVLTLFAIKISRKEKEGLCAIGCATSPMPLGTPLPPQHAPKQAGNTRANCRVIVGWAIADPVARVRMTGKSMLDVFGGSGFVAVATNYLGLRCYVLDTKFASRYDVTKPLVLTRTRQDVSVAQCVAAMISPPRLHTSCSPHAISASASFTHLLQGARMPWIMEPDSCGTASHGLGAVRCFVFLTEKGQRHFQDDTSGQKCSQRCWCRMGRCQSVECHFPPLLQCVSTKLQVHVTNVARTADQGDCEW